MDSTPRITPIEDLDFRRLTRAAYVVDTRLLERNARILRDVADAAGIRMLLALKGFAMWSAFPHLAPWLDGCTASGPIEAELAAQTFLPAMGAGRSGEVHTYAPAFSEEDFQESVQHSDHIVFNSASQLARFLPALQAHRASTGKALEVGIRVNPEYAEVEVDLYNPCAPGSRLGSTRAMLGDRLPDGVDGLHFHALCEQNADVLVRVLERVEACFGDWFPHLKWLNCGGGHWITKPDYNRDLLVSTLRGLRKRWPHLTVYLEPGEAAAVDTGVLVATVLDIHAGDTPTALLDVSATCHMPDVLEMPYRPTIHGAGEPHEKAFTYRLGGPTCLAGDVIGLWSFDHALAPGDKVVFADMAHYTMVKTTFFNGVRHPDLALWDGHDLRIVRSFGYAEFRDRLS